MTVDVDVCILGAGPAGACAAASAAGRGASVVLVDPHRSVPRGLELLSGRAGHTLAELGVLDEVRQIATASTGTVTRWATSHFVSRPAMLDPWGGGWIVDRAALDGLLVSHAVSQGARLVRGRASALERGEDGGVVTLRSHVSVRARTVVLATGRPGGLGRDLARAAVCRRIVALVADLGPDAVADLGTQLLVDRDRDGWWYGLGTTDRTTVAYCSDGELVGHGTAGVLATWRGACRRADWLPRAAVHETPRVRSRVIGAAVNPSGPGIRLVGDAALSVDPLSGHGLTLAIEGGARWRDPSLSSWLDEAAASHRDQERSIYRVDPTRPDGALPAQDAPDGNIWAAHLRRRKLARGVAAPVAST